MSEQEAIGSVPEPLGGFGIAIRTCWVVGSNLSVGRGWRSKDTLDLHSPPQFRTSIFGKGILEVDSICVIGSRDPSVREFDLTLKTDETAAKDWTTSKENWSVVIPHGDRTPEERLRRRIFEQLDERAPTAIMLPPVKDDPELGIKDQNWSMEIMLPADVVRQLEDDLLANRTGRIVLGIRWVGGLVLDEHAPPAFPTRWGLFRATETAYPEPLRGHVELIRWHLTQPSQTSEPNESAGDVQIVGRDLIREVEKLRTVISPIGNKIERNITVAFGFAVILILISYFLR
jgi:hypothetical protein